MNHIKLIVFGVVLVVVVVFGFIFWDDLKFNQQEISDMAVPPSPALDQSNTDSSLTSQRVQEQSQNTSDMSKADTYDAMDKDLTSTDLNVDSDLGSLETELQGL